MERKRRIFSGILNISVCISVLGSCATDDLPYERTDVSIIINGSMFNTKAYLPDDNKISDISLLIFDSNGLLEKSVYFQDGINTYTASLLKGERYSIYACANFGYAVSKSEIEEFKKIDFYLAYPDEYKEGIPMAASAENVLIRENCPIELDLERLMAHISLKMDRSHLSKGVNMDIIGVRIGNCPKKVTPFIKSKVNHADECFKVGFRHNDIECYALNSIHMDGQSDAVSLYMLENMQGLFKGIQTDQEKVFKENDPRAQICSYIELELEYSFENLASVSQPLIYRFYLGESPDNLDIERNCHYHITVTPEDDGLQGDGWRVDKSGITQIVTPSLRQYPSDYIRGDIGDIIHIGCELYPSDAPFDVGIEYLEADKAEGIYDYTIDKDGHGVTLTLTGPGTGLIYMEAGAPIDDAALFFIEVNL